MKNHKTRLKRFLSFFCCLLLATSACLPGVDCSAGGTGSCTHVLFVGNSYTFVNDLPNMFAQLARSGGHTVETGMKAQGGWSLADHVAASDVLDEMKSSNWDFVVLQEQSEIPAFQQSRTVGMYPAARTLVEQIRSSGATPVFFMTWAHRDGSPQYGLNSYEDMQFQIDDGYLGIAAELNAPVAPVGFAWLTALRQDPKLELWQADGSHPTQQGTYLAACVFYAAIFRQSPEGLAFRADLSKDVAESLQTVAANTVLDALGQWNLH
jgi:hypothetical protein